MTYINICVMTYINICVMTYINICVMTYIDICVMTYINICVMTYINICVTLKIPNCGGHCIVWRQERNSGRLTWVRHSSSKNRMIFPFLSVSAVFFFLRLLRAVHCTNVVPIVLSA